MCIQSIKNAAKIEHLQQKPAYFYKKEKVVQPWVVRKQLALKKLQLLKSKGHMRRNSHEVSKENEFQEFAREEL